MLGAAFPLEPILGQVLKGFAYNGRSWVKTRGAEWQNVRVFTASGQYVPSPDLLYCVVECIGPGGGGGWATLDVDGVTGYPVAAGGGGSGGYSRKTLPAEFVIQGVDVVVGAGGLVGVGQVGGTKTSGDTNFGGLCVAYGGIDARAYDGSGSVVAAHGLAGAGGALGIGDFCEPGASGGMFAAIKVNIGVQHLDGAVPGLGGQLFGGAAWPPAAPGQSWLFTNSNGSNAAPNSGAGGGGAQVNTGSTPITMFGGAGGSGLCVVTEICGTENGGGGPGPEPPGPSWPPGVPVNIKARVAVFPADPCGPHVEPVK